MDSRSGVSRVAKTVWPDLLPVLDTASLQLTAVAQVHWLSWDFHIGHTILAGIYLNDIRFRNERIVYELALQATSSFIRAVYASIMKLHIPSVLLEMLHSYYSYCCMQDAWASYSGAQPIQAMLML